MENSTMGIAEMITRVIQDGQLSEEQEAALRELLVQRAEQGCKTLSEYMEREMKRSIDALSDRAKEVYDRLYRCCIKERNSGDVPAAELSEEDVRKFIVRTAMSYEMDSEMWYLFLAVLHNSLHAMRREGLLGYAPPINFHWKYCQVTDRLQRIEQPYHWKELAEIRSWIRLHNDDVRALAVALWLMGEISPQEITNLKMSSLIDSNGKQSGSYSVIKKNASEDYLIITKQRWRIIEAALKLHPESKKEKDEYIFMEEKKGKWGKMPMIAMQAKLSIICRQVGIEYKSFRYTDRILWGFHSVPGEAGGIL